MLEDTGYEPVVSEITPDSQVDTSKSANLSLFGRFIKFVKIAIPHLCLYLVISGYLVIGSSIFAALEDDYDREKRIKKLDEIQKVYENIANQMGDICRTPEQKEALYKSLGRISTFMEDREFILSPNKIPNVDELLPPTWDRSSSLLFALSILTTTGYGYANPETGFGQCIAMIYGMIGIPLMVLAAVDIGRFLSDVVIFVYSKLDMLTSYAFCNRLFGITKKSKLVTKVETRAIKVLKERRRSWRGKSKNLLKSPIEESTTSLSSPIISPKSPPPSAPPPVASASSQETPKKRLPLSVNATVLLLFCMLGGLVYRAAGSEKAFIEGFFITFNLVANLTMSEMPDDLSNIFTMFYIGFFVIFGVAVLSMCADLAASELKWFFLKIHYFGRKINWKRKNAKKEQMEVEVKELLKIINQIRAKYPNKAQITPVDILEYMQELNGKTDSQYYITQHRRDTIAFMPRSIEALKFADDMDLDDASHRSVVVALPDIDSEKTSLLEMM
uniref:Potassium channel domain-containing protein n=1 Tax=Panagrolaimus sp. PS1159 TaxID=55785 RepID=A0AC35GG49_9BILA